MANELGGANKRELKALDKLACAVDALADKYAQLSDSQLAQQTELLKDRLSKGENLDDIMFDAFAVCREASSRVLHMRHFYVQIMGGIALHQGRICQMATGEGKTLVATLPAYLNALSSKGVHIVTVNDYLAKRDAEWMGKVYKYLGLSVGVIYSGQQYNDKKLAYQCDITYGTNTEFGFDYLRDNMATRLVSRVQRPLNFVIIDEVDSILIDEARTPLIISGRSNKSSDMYITANKFARILRPNVDYEVDEKHKAVQLTDEGIEKAERFFKVDNLADIDNTELNHYINNAVRAHAIMHRDDNYIVEKGQIVIVDEFTGRKMEGRRYSGGLHQAIEAKENVAIKEENRTLATITYQNLFRLYTKMSGMTGTAKTEENEFNNIYNIDVVVIPTNLPNARKDYNDKIYQTREAKLNNAVKEVVERHNNGQPVLIGTVTVEKSEELSKLLSRQGIRHNVLNAKNHAKEAEIVAQAGRLGAVTIATNMAGRGTDILLGGNPEFMAKQDMSAKGYNAEQIELATSYIEGDEQTEAIKAVYQQLYAQRKTATDEEKIKVIEAGGLHILGTERHDSRRIDNQLRGRAGRQGDVGSSVFYVSCEDDMMRIFGERIGAILSMLRLDKDIAIESRVLTSQLESAQKRIENLHFSARKNILKFDDVNNIQRNTIYAERNKVLMQPDINDEIITFTVTYARKALEDACEGNEKTRQWDRDKVNSILTAKYYPVDYPLITQEDINGNNARVIVDKLSTITQNMLQARQTALKELGIDYYDLQKYILLKITDEKWMDHMDAMDQLQQGVGLQAIGQHDPFSVYKEQGFKMFEQLMDDIQFTTVKYLLFAQVAKQERPRTVAQNAKRELKDGEKVGFNEPCPCGSGEKYKNCCGREQALKAKEEWRKNKSKN
ncbi:MAG: preprotein translocase subunit SecA [Clostridia bacterium]|nr:preprotein translocase subunit SecA [Clostridia bacterium]